MYISLSPKASFANLFHHWFGSLSIAKPLPEFMLACCHLDILWKFDQNTKYIFQKLSLKMSYAKCHTSLFRSQFVKSLHIIPDTCFTLVKKTHTKRSFNENIYVPANASGFINGIACAQWRCKTPTARLFVKQYVPADNKTKETPKFRFASLLWG